MEFSYKIKGLVVFVSCIIAALLFFVIQSFTELIDILSIINFLFVVLVFYFFDVLFNIGFEKRHYFYIVFVGFFGFFLGFLGFVYSHYDKIFHFVAPVMLAAIVFFILRKWKIERGKALLLTFLLSVGFLGLHEVLEYVVDILFDFKLQGVFIYSNGGFVRVMSERLDTVIDMLLGGIGVLVYVFYEFRKS